MVSSHSRGKKRERNSNANINVSSHTDESTQEKAKELSTLFVNETVIQESCYIGVFCITHVPVFASNIALVILDGPRHPNLFFEGCPYFFYPLGGFFNILTYIRPKVAYMRRSDPTLHRSWLLCLWKVLKAGGDIPKEALSKRQIKKENRKEAEKNMSSVPFGGTPVGEESSENHSISLKGWHGSRLNLVESHDDDSISSSSSNSRRSVSDDESGNISFGSNSISEDNDASIFHQY